jgi:hypothetical protein
LHRYISPARPALFFHIAIALVFLSVGASKPQAQTSRDVRLNRTIEARQKALRDLENSKEPPPKPVEPRLLYEQLKEDFEQLQVINNSLSTMVDSRSALDYEQIRKDAAEVNKRAARLKANLSLPEPAKGEKLKKEQGEFSPEGLKWALKALNSLVKSFVENPVFQQLNVIDVESSKRASRDLDGIIKLSEQIYKRAEVLNKAAAKSL